MNFDLYSSQSVAEHHITAFSWAEVKFLNLVSLNLPLLNITDDVSFFFLSYEK